MIDLARTNVSPGENRWLKMCQCAISIVKLGCAQGLRLARPMSVLKTFYVGPNSSLTLPRSRVRCGLDRLKKRLLMPCLASCSPFFFLPLSHHFPVSVGPWLLALRCSFVWISSRRAGGGGRGGKGAPRRCTDLQKRRGRTRAGGGGGGSKNCPPPLYPSIAPPLPLELGAALRQLVKTLGWPGRWFLNRSTHKTEAF